ncbi:hypothetical protein ACNAW0_03680 [Micromonospora sp. SL1-18]
MLVVLTLPTVAALLGGTGSTELGWGRVLTRPRSPHWASRHT